MTAAGAGIRPSFARVGVIGVLAALPLGALLGAVDMRAERPDYVLATTVTVATLAVEPLPPTVPAIGNAPAVATSPARRVALPTLAPVETRLATTTTWVLDTPPLPGLDSCDVARQLLVDYAPPGGWDIDRMMRIVRRESGVYCKADAWNRRGRAACWLQITPTNYPYLRDELDEWVDRWTLLSDPVQCIRAGAALFTYWADAVGNGYQPWRLP